MEPSTSIADAVRKQLPGPGFAARLPLELALDFTLPGS